MVRVRIVNLYESANFCSSAIRNFSIVVHGIIFLLMIFCFSAKAQLKYVVEDFEGFSDGTAGMKANGIFTYGNSKATIDYQSGNRQSGSYLDYAGERFISLYKTGKSAYGGWGKGIGLLISLDHNTDFLNFYVQAPNDTTSIKIELQEDDNGNGIYEKDRDDSWINYQKFGKLAHHVPVQPQAESKSWKLISIPLLAFKDDNKGGDGIFNCNYKQGKLLCFIISFINAGKPGPGENWSFDFICFSKGKLPTGTGNMIMDAPPASPGDFCNLGVWSKEGNIANFSDIATGFENHFKYGSDKKLGVVHFFQPFAFDGGNQQNLYPSVERINKVIKAGYIPMITLEDHFVNATPGIKQPNLYSIVEGHFDGFVAEWAKQIKQVEGVVLLRILHEFNGDWYPWCIANNDKNPELLIKAFRHIHDIFKKEKVDNVKFIWCPNSTSFPQEKWNQIMEAYPGDAYVDYVGLDVYNGAGKSTLWRSFRKEGIENYFILTELLPHKPLFICELASRERLAAEPAGSQNKAEWIRQMSEALGSDMSKIRLLCWFNEKSTFPVSSSSGAQGAFLDYIMKNPYFKSGIKNMLPLLSP